MGVSMNRWYPNIADAKAFSLCFTNMAYIYDDTCLADYEEEPCDRCGYTVQNRDYLMPKAQFKKPYAILDSIKFGVSQELRDELIEHFAITEEDFRPIRSKRGAIVFYQITPRHTMLPIRKENGWRPCNCRKCGAVRYTNEDFENENGESYYFISQEALDEMHDLNVTYETFGCSVPMYIISRRVYEFLVEKFPRTRYEPLFLRTDE